MEQSFLILRRTPATIDDDLDPVASGISGRLPESADQIGVEVGHGRSFLIEDRDAVRYYAVSLARYTTMGGGDRRDEDEQARDKDPGHAPI